MECRHRHWSEAIADRRQAIRTTAGYRLDHERQTTRLPHGPFWKLCALDNQFRGKYDPDSHRDTRREASGTYRNLGMEGSNRSAEAFRAFRHRFVGWNSGGAL